MSFKNDKKHNKNFIFSKHNWTNWNEMSLILNIFNVIYKENLECDKNWIFFKWYKKECNLKYNKKYII